ncbi:MAG: D-alanyl-D-alanine carboxypeptidase/D-alanyl-D-alanine-endopeptidase [Calditrichaeota bacterium]|nr:MAG: D-alanyl-D-alanine carboxypeptidase/D-alanyl-D-alanine-endopeptidase [Calditrichota bacterium]
MNLRPVFLTLLSSLLFLTQSCSTSSSLLKSNTVPQVNKFEPIYGLEALQSELNLILADPELAAANTGVVVSRIEDGKVLFEHNTDKLFHPASTMKLYTSAAAVNYLGLDYSFRTLIAVDSGTVVADTLKSNLYIIGGGDPVFSTADLAGLVNALGNKGINYISGDIICDASFLDDQSVGDGWMWDDAGSWYSAPLSALSIQENCIEVFSRPAVNSDDPAKISLLPATDYLKIVNTSTTVDSVTYYSQLFDTTKTFEKFNIERRWREKENTLEVSGLIGDWFAEDQTTVDIVNAPLYFGTLFKEECASNGIGIAGKIIEGMAPASRLALAAHESKSLAQLLADMNKPSSNLCAELFLKTVGAKSTGKPGTARDGIHSLNKLLISWDIDTTGIKFSDGSGVSRYTLVTPATTHKLLVAMYDEFSWRHEFIASLPVAGVDGTLRSRMQNTAAAAVVHAKTGTLSGVSSLAGYTTSADGDELAFSIMMSHFVGSSKSYRNAQDKICDAISRFREVKK